MELEMILEDKERRKKHQRGGISGKEAAAGGDEEAAAGINEERRKKQWPIYSAKERRACRDQINQRCILDKSCAPLSHHCRSTFTSIQNLKHSRRTSPDVVTVWPIAISHSNSASDKRTVLLLKYCSLKLLPYTNSEHKQRPWSVFGLLLFPHSDIS
ncbi:hypothetical protein LWI28_014401 [Acer negundo]|uniref:Uncharacterized protein n=1 Tax=Acer negundo TaxID=4023 RepID=A0AAD5NT46_ACENE|nr:hypothetical protein LWI28_014401 [Acer negundo]